MGLILTLHHDLVCVRLAILQRHAGVPGEEARDGVQLEVVVARWSEQLVSHGRTGAPGGVSGAQGARET